MESLGWIGSAKDDLLGKIAEIIKARKLTQAKLIAEKLEADGLTLLSNFETAVKRNRERDQSSKDR